MDAVTVITVAEKSFLVPKTNKMMPLDELLKFLNNEIHILVIQAIGSWQSTI